MALWLDDHFVTNEIRYHGGRMPLPSSRFGLVCLPGGSRYQIMHAEKLLLIDPHSTRIEAARLGEFA